MLTVGDGRWGRPRSRPLLARSVYPSDSPHDAPIRRFRADVGDGDVGPPPHLADERDHEDPHALGRQGPDEVLEDSSGERLLIPSPMQEAKGFGETSSRARYPAAR